MKIELLHMDDCPSWETGLENLKSALQLEGITADIHLIRVLDDVQAAHLKFLGSPSFRVDGRDLWPEEREMYALSCRIYPSPQGSKGWPSVGMLRQKLRENQN